MFRKQIGVGVLAILCVLGAFWLWIWLRGDEARGIRALPPEVRAGLYQRTLANLREVCGARAPVGLESYCEQEARFAVQFDECDSACFALARVEPTRPTR